MQQRSDEPSDTMRDVLLETYTINEAINQLILEQLDARAWRAQPPGRGVRPIAAIFAHVHNVRCKWLRLSAPHLRRPEQLDRARCTQRQARSALAKSAACCTEMLAEAFRGPGAQLNKFVRDGWSRPWAPGGAMFAYMLSHEAHHRGQVCLLAHQLGYPIKDGYKLWAWEKLWKDCSFTRPR